MDIVNIFEVFNEYQNVIYRVRRARVINIRPDYFNIYDDLDFVRRFRLTKESVMIVFQDIRDRISSSSDKNNAVPPLHRLLLALRFYATGCMLRTVGDYSGISTTSACDFVYLVTVALCSLRTTYIKMPENDEVRQVQRDFYSIARMPCVVGTIDCTHIKLLSPGGDQAETFRNRKHFISLNVQTVSDARLKIRSLVARWPGSSHDQIIFDHSILKSRFENGEFGNGLLLGDSGYANTNYLVTPVKRVMSEAQNKYNEAHIRTRNTVERQYGVWKRRFPVLYIGLRLSLERTQAVITACAILHNIAIEQGEPETPSDPDVEVFREIINQDELPIRAGNDTRRDQLIQRFQNMLDRNGSNQSRPTLSR